ncbi:hypothetical protein HMSSN036_95600 [Paenibacillus macerans]|nr:hypothetical protein HMSSN036_95600 [Paenibacillus macerans]
MDYIYYISEFEIEGVGIMYLVDDEYSEQAAFLSAGTFITNQPWIHQERVIDSYEIICPIDSTLHIESNRVPYAIESGEILLIPPHTFHRGLKVCEGRLKFHWLHFSGNHLSPRTEAEVIRKINEKDPDEMIILPIYTNKIDSRRFHVMFNQLLDLYQEKKPRSYLNAYLSCLLYEFDRGNQKLPDPKSIQRQRCSRFRIGSASMPLKTSRLNKSPIISNTTRTICPGFTRKTQESEFRNRSSNSG